MKRLRRGTLLTLLLAACTSTGPSGPDDGGGGHVTGNTAFWNGREAALLGREDGFLPDNQFGQPEPDFRYFVVEVEVRNRSAPTESANMFDFELGLSDNSRITPGPGWKEPSFGFTTLNTGESLRGWILFEIPISASPTRLFWSPAFNVTLGIPVP